MLKVKILAHTPNPEKVIAMSAKLCYSPVGVDEIEENLTDESIEKFLNMLINMGHESPVEHITFTFGIEGVSRSLTHQLVRHRIASFSQQSQRYVKLDQFEYIIPPEIEKSEYAKNIFIKQMENSQKAYDILVKTLQRAGRTEKQAIEDARYVFPNACETKIVVTMNIRSLYNFFEHRCCERAQWEIRELATEMLRQCKEISPILFANCGPKCVKGKCPEGNMSCGLSKEKRNLFVGE